MAVIQVQSIHDAVSKGTLIELAKDYRTSRTVKSCLPDETSHACAISTAAFCQHIQQGTPREKQAKMEGLCLFLSRAAGLGTKPSRSDPKSREGAQPEGLPLKLEWYAPDKYWVVLLPDEQIQPVGAS